MSGQDVPYHLRTNKFVERLLFTDILDFVRRWNGPSRYAYASMGGRFLEDFKLLNDRFAIEHMFSVEIDSITSARQHFNRPNGFVECINQSSGEFITDFDRRVADHPDKRFIVWLDYAVANDRGRQLQEYQELIPKLAAGDVVKITLNANHMSFRQPSQFAIKKDWEHAVIANLVEQLGEYMPIGGMTAADLKSEQFARLLARAVKVAALKGNRGSDLRILPLAVFRYRDGEHQMLTVTALLASDILAGLIREDHIFSDWPFRSREWDDVHPIKIPDLSLRERLLINQMMQVGEDEGTIHARLPFRLDRKDPESLALLKSYLAHYRRYPSFGRFQ